MPKLPAIEGLAFVKFLEWMGFTIIRSKGSHIRMKDERDRITTIPVHKSKILPKGLLRKIIREDLEINLTEFLELYKRYKN